MSHQTPEPFDWKQPDLREDPFDPPTDYARSLKSRLDRRIAAREEQRGRMMRMAGVWSAAAAVLLGAFGLWWTHREPVPATPAPVVAEVPALAQLPDSVLTAAVELPAAATLAYAPTEELLMEAAATEGDLIDRLATDL